jgi:hypothetical protein
MKVITEKTGVQPNSFYEEWYDKYKIWKGNRNLGGY